MDLKDVMSRLVNAVLALKRENLSLQGWKHEWTFGNEKDLIIIASEIIPSDLIKMPTDDVKGIICERGGASAHIAILAKAFNIPVINGCEECYDNRKQWRRGNNLWFFRKGAYSPL